MNRTEAMILLTSIARVDNRNIDREVAVVWADLLDDVTLEAAMPAAHEHLRSDTRWLTPAILRDRIESPEPASPSAVSVAEALAVPDTGGDESPDAYIRALREMQGVPAGAPVRSVGVRTVRGELA